MPEPVDFVWPYLGSAAEGDEFCYSIASVRRFFAETPRIWLVCEPADRPAWADGEIRFIEYRWEQGSRPTRRPFDSMDKLIAAYAAARTHSPDKASARAAGRGKAHLGGATARHLV